MDNDGLKVVIWMLIQIYNNAIYMYMCDFLKGSRFVLQVYKTVDSEDHIIKF